ncbi:MAG: bacteriophage holin [Rhodothermia bacterium]|nr:bacteriophage holin [Rhodothermia bacterium]
MQTKLCPKCGAVNDEAAETCECGFSFDADEQYDPVQDMIRSSLAGLLGGGPLSVRALAIAAAIFWGGAVFLTTWWLILFDGATGEPLFLGRIYFGYSVSPLGSVIGLLWGLVDGAISGAVLAWLYNVALLRFSAKKRDDS